MSLPPRFSIDLSERFPRLLSAPSIEAVIHWQARAGKTLEPETLKAELAHRIPDYPILQSQQDVQFGATGTPDGSSEFFQRTQWSGFRLQDEQSRHVAQFTLNGVVFSRLQPYEEWAGFQTEALRFWHIFLELAEPTAIQRLGVRYINRISLDNGEQPSKYLNTVPAPPPGLELTAESFFHQDTYLVPGYPYSINWVRTIQPTGADPTDGRALIVDIDVFAHDLLQLDQDTLIQQLQEMRWLKNKVFFSCITDHALEQFGATS
jgi:uncharacterized protein (TIGR04255 family)